MFVCDRCGGTFKATAVTSASCPRCRAAGVGDPLMRFRLFEGSAVAGFAPRHPGGGAPGGARRGGAGRIA